MSGFVLKITLKVSEIDATVPRKLDIKDDPKRAKIKNKKNILRNFVQYNAYQRNFIIWTNKIRTYRAEHSRSGTKARKNQQPADNREQVVILKSVGLFLSVYSHKTTYGVSSKRRYITEE